MAIFHYSVGHVSRSTGRSPVQSAAYITRNALYEERRGVSANYQNAGPVLVHETLLPEGADESFKDTQKVWNHFDHYEDKYARVRYKTEETQEKYMMSARTALTIEFALPLELSPEVHEEMVRDFLEKTFVAQGHVVTFAIHPDEGNPHAHAQISTRAMGEDGTISYTKNRDMSSRLGLVAQREAWARTANFYLEREGISARIDHRSYEEQGIDLIPSVHEGWYARRLAARGETSRLVEENKDIAAENATLVATTPSLILEELTRQRATFGEGDILKLVQKRTQDIPELAQHVFESVLKEAVPVGYDLWRRPRYTSQEYRETEAALVDHLKVLTHARVEKEIPSARVEASLKERQEGGHLSPEQEAAVRSFCGRHAFGVLVGRAGTGKTTGVLKPVVELHQAAGFKVMGMALAAEAARVLQQETGCESATIASYLYRWHEYEKLDQKLSADHFIELKQRRALDEGLHSYDSQFIPTKDTLILVDEAGMVGTKQWRALSAMALKTGAKLLVCGDDHQYKAIEAGDAFRKALEIAKEQDNQVELTQIFRQKEAWMAEASLNLARLETKEALMAYERRGHAVGCDTEGDLIDEMASDYGAKIQEDPTSSGCVLTSTNGVRVQLNGAIRKNLQGRGLLAADLFSYQGRKYALGDQLIFLKNDKKGAFVRSDTKGVHVTNGTRGVLERVTFVSKVKVSSQKGKRLRICQVPHLIVRTKEGARLSFSLDAYDKIDHAYALTGHKSQGQTVDWSFVHLSKQLDAYGLYVMLTRHRRDVTIYYNKEEVGSFERYSDQVRTGYKDLVVDYTILPEHEEFYFNVEDYKLLGREIVLGIKNNQDVSALIQERKVLGHDILSDQDAHRLFVLQGGLTFERIAMATGVKRRPLSVVEERAAATTSQYALAALEARDMWREIRKTAPGSLAKSHPDYASFKDLCAERDSLASLIMTAPSLHRPFLKDVHKALGYGIAGIKKQAESFQASQLKAALHQHPDRGECLRRERLLSYVSARDEARARWSGLKPALKKKESQRLSASLDKEVNAFKEASRHRDVLAHEITHHLEDYQKTAAALHLPLDTARLFDQAEKEHPHLCLENYQKSNLLLVRLLSASALHEMLVSEKEGGAPITRRALQERKIDVRALEADAKIYSQEAFYGTLKTPQEKEIWGLLSTYQGGCQTTKVLYSLCVEEADRNGTHPWQTPSHQALIQACVARDAAAYALTQGDHSLTSSLAGVMEISLKTVDKEALAHTAREREKASLRAAPSPAAMVSASIDAWVTLEKEITSSPRKPFLKEPQQERDQEHLPKESLSSLLEERVGELADHVLGKPSAATSFQRRYGRKGSVCVHVAGARKGLYANFETGTHGGPLTLIEEQRGLSKEGATAWARDWLRLEREAPRPRPQKKKEPLPQSTWTPVFPVPLRAGAPDITGNRFLSSLCRGREVKALYEYRSQKGERLGYVVRLEDKDGHKITPTLTYCQNEEGARAWRWKGFGEQRPLYGLDRLTKEKPVLVVEGEKAADAAQALLPEYAVLTWSGGCGAVRKADWSPLKGKDVAIWPDHDAPGKEAAQRLASLLHEMNKESRHETTPHPYVVEVPPHLPQGWDLADKRPDDLSREHIRSLIKPDAQEHTLDEKAAPSKEAQKESLLKDLQHAFMARQRNPHAFEAVKDKVGEVAFALHQTDGLSSLKDFPEVFGTFVKDHLMHHEEKHGLSSPHTLERYLDLRIHYEKTGGLLGAGNEDLLRTLHGMSHRIWQNDALKVHIETHFPESFTKSFKAEATLHAQTLDAKPHQHKTNTLEMTF